jgi:hypothetical protein
LSSFESRCFGRNINSYKLKQKKNERSSFDIFQLCGTVQVFFFVDDEKRIASSIKGMGNIAQLFCRKLLCKSEVKKGGGVQER